MVYICATLINTFNKQYTIHNKQYVNYKLYTGTQTHLRRQQGRMVKVSLFCKSKIVSGRDDSRVGTGGQVTQAKVGFPPEGLEGRFFQSGGIWRDNLESSVYNYIVVQF